MEDLKTQIKPNTYKNYPYSFSENSSRAFFCNSILFLNQGTTTVLINDIFPLSSGASLEISGNQNEIDSTVYKLGFTGAGTNLLNIWTKEDRGQLDYNKYPANAFYTKNVSKRIQDAQRNGREAIKGEKNNKVNAKFKGDF